MFPALLVVETMTYHSIEGEIDCEQKQNLACAFIDRRLEERGGYIVAGRFVWTASSCTSIAVCLVCRACSN